MRKNTFKMTEVTIIYKENPDAWNNFLSTILQYYMDKLYLEVESVDE